MTSSDSKTRIVVVGNGMVGHHFVEQLHSSDANADITVLCGESRLAYDRVYLSSYFSGASADDLALTTPAQYASWGVNVVTNAIVTDIDRENKTVVTSEGQKFDYDKLVLATGSYPFVPPIKGNDQEHCLVYRTIEDLLAIEASASVSKVGVVVGGGLLGLEAANALKQAWLDTHVVEFAPQLMAVQLDTTGGDVLKQKISSLGVTVHTQKATQSIEAGDSCRYKMVFADGSELETDMILFSAGIRPSDQLGKKASLTLGERGGIAIDNHCLTSDPNIYAIGECALWDNKIFG
ncbi:MAG: FAD-dependent oxidoreductase, partial [Pseudomonadota bacterium]|nr:FAD-dependent oxidoreductase [Pseudomonadota bacterium]